MDAIVVDELRKRYGNVQALEGVSFAVRAGEVFGLLGPNGAGKSTTVKVLATLTKPDAGRADVAGHDVVREPNAVRRAIGYVPQSSGVDRDATGRENLILQGRVQGMSGRALETRVAELLDLLGLAPAADRVVRGYSGGMKRRLDVGLGLVHRPQVLFLDEPTTGLDPAARRAVWDAVLSLRERGRTVVLTTHYMEEAETLCDRVAVMDHGKIMATGTPRELIRDYGSELAIEFTAPPGGLDSAMLAGLPEVTGVKVTEREVVLFSGKIEATLIGQITELQARSLHVTDLRTRSSTLEDVFLTLTGRRLRD